MGCVVGEVLRIRATGALCRVLAALLVLVSAALVGALAGCNASRPVGPHQSEPSRDAVEPDATVPTDAGALGTEQEGARVAPRDGADARVAQHPSPPISVPDACPRANVSTAEASFDVWQVPVPFCVATSGVADAGAASPESEGGCALHAPSPVGGERGRFDEARTREAMRLRPGHRVCCYVACVMPGTQKRR